MSDYKMDVYKKIEENVHELCKGIDRLFTGEPASDCIVALQMEMAQAMWLMRDEMDNDAKLEIVVDGIRGYYDQIAERERAKR